MRIIKSMSFLYGIAAAFEENILFVYRKADFFCLYKV